MRTFLSSLALIVSAQAGAADCTGASLLTSLSDQAQATLLERADATLYGTGKHWELTRGADTIKLVGTVHIYDPRLDAIRDALLPTLSQSDVLLTEVTPAEETALLRALTEDRSIAFITEGPTLIEQLPQEQWARIADALAARQVPGFMGAQMQPWYLTLTLGLPPCALASMARGERGLDHMFMQQAQSQGIPNVALEDWQTPIDLMREGTDAEHLDMLDLTLAMDVYSGPATATLLDLYFAGNIAQIWELQRASLELLPVETDDAIRMLEELEDALLIQRNLNWMSVIEDQAARHDDIFIAVGAAHLPGENGLISLLVGDGWSAAQVSSP